MRGGPRQLKLLPPSPREGATIHPQCCALEEEKTRGRFRLRAKRGGRGLRSKTERAQPEVDAFTPRDAFRVSADARPWIGAQAREGKDAAVHLERCGGTWAAIIGG